MDTSPGTDGQLTSSHGSSSEQAAHSPDVEMTKRSNHYLYDRPGSKTGFASCFRFPKFSWTVLRRSWKFKLGLFLVMCAMAIACLYSGVLSLLAPSLSYNLILKQSDSIKAPRVAIEILPDDLKRIESPQNDLDILRILNDENEPDRKGERRFPSSIIFGVSKCGTRAVLEYLKLHPDVVAPMAEVNFFNNDTLFKRGAKWYLQQMPFARNQQLIVEKSPDYFQYPECASVIHRMNSDIKLLLLLRDPVERLVSQYMQLLAKNPNLPRFEDWVIQPQSGEVNTNVPSVMVSAYAKYVEDWLTVFPRDQMLIIESNSLRHHPFMEMKRVEKFLNLKPFYEESDFYFNSTRGFYCLRYRSTGKTKCLGKSKGRQHIPVDRDVLKILYSFYQPYNQQLNKLLGRKFPWS